MCYFNDFPKEALCIVEFGVVVLLFPSLIFQFVHNDLFVYEKIKTSFFLFFDKD